MVNLSERNKWYILGVFILTAHQMLNSSFTIPFMPRPLRDAEKNLTVRVFDGEGFDNTDHVHVNGTFEHSLSATPSKDTTADLSNDTTANLSNDTTANATAAPDTLCEWSSRHSTMSLWNKHLKDLLVASKMPRDPKFRLHDLTAYVLQVMTPRLVLGQRSVPRHSIAPLLDKIQARWDVLQQGGQEARTRAASSGPIRIVVLGGSVTYGVNCRTGIRHYDYSNCAWPARLENLLNQLAGGPLVQISNLAMGGTNTAVGKDILAYELMPSEARDADVIINAYSTNDMHVLTMKEAKENGKSLREKTFDMAQEFSRVVLGKCPEKRPLLLWLDDYLGNEQRGILETTELSQGLQVLANYYGYGFVSYADTVRDLVYGTTNETLFSPAGWYKASSDIMFREIHPGAAMHIAVSYVMAYYMLQTASSSCATHEDWRSITHYTGGHGLPEPKNNDSPEIQGRPRPTPEKVLPRLNSPLSLFNVTKEWHEAESLPTCSETGCPVSWLIGISGVFDKRGPVAYAMETLEPYFVKPMGWSLRDDREVPERKKKYGFSPNNTSGGEVMELQFDFDQDIRSVQVFFMKSYGALWKNSTVDLQVLVENQIVTSKKLVGFHDKETSETYSEGIQLPESLRKFHIRFLHLAGQTFKITGFAVCS